jgi:hypothetical protein
MNLPKLPKELKIHSYQKEIEKQIVSKLMQNKTLSQEEYISYINITSFHIKLKKFLRDLNFKDLTKKEIHVLSKYIKDIFYFMPENTSPLEINKLYRLVVNKNIHGSNGSIEHTKFLTYPPDHIVRKNGKYNRANSPFRNVFYGSESIPTAVFELKPKPGDKVTLSEWSPLKTNLFIMYFIFHEKVISGTSRVSSIIKAKHDEHVKQFNPMLKDFFSAYTETLGYEFSKPVNHHLEYLVSAILSDRIISNDIKYHNKIDGIIFPSVNNNFNSHNIAMKKNVIRNRFELSKVSEFIVSETYYESVYKDQLSQDPLQEELLEAHSRRDGDIIGNKIKWQNKFY